MTKVSEERERRRKQLIYNSHSGEKLVFVETRKEEKMYIHCGIVLDQDALYCKLCGRAIRRSRHISSAVERVNIMKKTIKKAAVQALALSLSN